MNVISIPSMFDVQSVEIASVAESLMVELEVGKQGRPMHENEVPIREGQVMSEECGTPNLLQTITAPQVGNVGRRFSTADLQHR